MVIQKSVLFKNTPEKNFLVVFNSYNSTQVQLYFVISKSKMNSVGDRIRIQFDNLEKVQSGILRGWRLYRSVLRVQNSMHRSTSNFSLFTHHSCIQY